LFWLNPSDTPPVFRFSFGHTSLAPSRSRQTRKSVLAFLQAEGRRVIGNSNAGCSARVLPHGYPVQWCDEALLRGKLKEMASMDKGTIVAVVSVQRHWKQGRMLTDVGDRILPAM
jgi:hypothetical protein